MNSINRYQEAYKDLAIQSAERFLVPDVEGEDGSYDYYSKENVIRCIEAVINCKNENLSPPVAAILMYEVERPLNSGVCGQQLGVDGTGEFADVFYGTDMGKVMNTIANKIQELRKHYKLGICRVVYREPTYYRDAIEHITVE